MTKRSSRKERTERAVGGKLSKTHTQQFPEEGISSLNLKEVLSQK